LILCALTTNWVLPGTGRAAVRHTTRDPTQIDSTRLDSLDSLNFACLPPAQFPPASRQGKVNRISNGCTDNTRVVLLLYEKQDYSKKKNPVWWLATYINFTICRSVVVVVAELRPSWEETAKVRKSSSRKGTCTGRRFTLSQFRCVWSKISISMILPTFYATARLTGNFETYWQDRPI